MNTEELYDLYDRRQSAYRMQTVMLTASVIGGIIGALVLVRSGWIPSLILLLLSLLAFALSCVFELLASLFEQVGALEKSVRPRNGPSPPHPDKQISGSPQI